MARKSIFTIFVIMIAVICLCGQEPYYWDITDEDGLPSMTVYDIEQDSLGYIWIGTAAGLCRYDGKEFEYFTHPDQADDEILFLEVDPHGRIWYSNLSDQVFFVNNGQVNQADIQSPSNLPIVNFEFTDSLVLIFMSSNKSLKYGGGMAMANILQNRDSMNFNFQEFEFLFLDGKISDGNLYSIITTPGSKRVIKTKLDSLIFTRLQNNDSEIICSLSYNSVSGKGTTYFISIDSQIILNQFEQLLFYDSGFEEGQQVSFENDTKNILIDKREENIWFTGFHKGVIEIDIVERRRKKHFFQGSTFNTGLFDKSNNLWLGTTDNGIQIIPSLNFVQAKERKTIRTICPIDKEKIVVGLSGEEVSILDVKEGSYQNLPFPILSQIRDIKALSNGNFILGTNETLFEMSLNGDIVRKHPGDGNSIKSLFIDSKNRIWVGNYRGTYVVTEDYWIKNAAFYKNIYASVLSKRTYGITEDHQSNIWIGTSKGLHVYDGEIEKPFLQDGIHQPYRYTSLGFSPYDSSVWAATHGDGLFKIKNNQVVAHYHSENQLSGDIINNLFIDEYNHLWIATNKGLNKLDLKTGAFELINKYDGLPSNEIISIVVAGRTVYVGTNRGLVTFPITAKTYNDIAPPIHLTNVSIFEKDTILHPEYQLNYTQNSIQIDFIGFAYKSRGNINYQYRMLGIDTNWVTTKSRFARFPALAPGDYEFHVVALNEDGVASKQPAVVTFEISPPFWKTLWFQLGTLLIAGLTIAWFVNLRNNRIRRQEKLEQGFKDKLSELRTQALQTQMNPHFIFNSLNAIQHYLVINDEKMAMTFLSRFAKLIRNIFDYSKEKSISLDKEIAFIDLYVSLEKLRFKEKVEILFEIDPKIEELRLDFFLPPLLIQPIIENSFKHGLFHKNGNGLLKISFLAMNEEWMKCTVEDNGVGRERAEALALKKNYQRKSSGLKSTIERIGLLNKDLDKAIHDLKNKLIVTDLYDQENKPCGTKVEINIKNQF